MKKNNSFIKRGFQTLVLTAVVSPLAAQNIRINIDDATFTKPLIEKLVSEYQKVDPEFHAQVVNDSEAEASIALTTETDFSAGAIARYFILPIANAESDILKEKKVQKGINQKVARDLFVEPTVDEQLDDPDKKQLPGTVYSLSGKYAAPTVLLAKKLQVEEKNIKGKKILGREENVLSILQKRPDAISVNVASLVYDQETRLPVSGVAVLPVDLDGNDKVSDEERSALGNIDLLTAYLDNSNNALPTGNVSIRTEDASVKKFTIWVSTTGQQYLAPYGYLKTNSNFTAQK